LPRTTTCVGGIKAGAESLMELAADDFAF